MDSPAQCGTQRSDFVSRAPLAGEEKHQGSVSIVIPALNEAPAVAARLAALEGLRAEGAEIIVADGGSADATCALAAPLCDLLIHAPRGRAAQMNAGALAATSDVLLFLHADTSLPDGALSLVAQALGGGSVWGRFDVRIEGRHPLLPMVASMMNLRSRLTGIATGDQAIFVRRSAFAQVGGFPDQPLMEDIALSARLKKLSRPTCLATRVTTSGRRWDDHGFWRTILLMWSLRLRYFLGADVRDLAREYGYAPRET